MDGKINQFSFVPYKLVTVTCELMNSLYHWKKLCYLFKIKLNKKLRNFSRFYWTFSNQHIPLSLIRITNISLFSNKNKKNLKKAYYMYIIFVFLFKFRLNINKRTTSTPILHNPWHSINIQKKIMSTFAGKILTTKSSSTL